MKIKNILTLFLLLGILCSCDYRNDDYSESIEIEGVKRVKLSGMFNVNISQYDQESLEIVGNEDLVKRLKVKQSGDLLELTLDGKTEGGFFNKKGIRIDLIIADLKELEFEGAGNIKTEHSLTLEDLRIIGNGVGNINLEIEAETVDSKLNFVGNMELRGETHEFYLINEGIGNIDASKFIAQKVDLISSGIGSVSVHCEDEISLEVNGIGTVNYTGNPTVISEKVSGIGKVNRK
ncbi:head GIN domain-containing protein [Aquiflexum sp.]|uniref:head GIN domain-containing protein n=1 Tax=Aquiflexum sp. TaxID=1872584 RepID=UPI0035943D68